MDTGNDSCLYLNISFESVAMQTLMWKNEAEGSTMLPNAASLCFFSAEHSKWFWSKWNFDHLIETGWNYDPGASFWMRRGIEKKTKSKRCISILRSNFNQCLFTSRAMKAILVKIIRVLDHQQGSYASNDRFNNWKSSKVEASIWISMTKLFTVIVYHSCPTRWNSWLKKTLTMVYTMTPLIVTTLKITWHPNGDFQVSWNLVRSSIINST